MENEKLIIEILTEMNKTMLEMKVVTKQEFQKVRQEMNGRFDTVESRLDNVENTVKLQQESHEKLSKTIHYHSHKIAEHDQEIFLINNQQ